MERLGAGNARVCMEGVSSVRGGAGVELCVRHDAEM